MGPESIAGIGAEAGLGPADVEVRQLVGTEPAGEVRTEERPRLGGAEPAVLGNWADTGGTEVAAVLAALERGQEPRLLDFAAFLGQQTFVDQTELATEDQPGSLGPAVTLEERLVPVAARSPSKQGTSCCAKCLPGCR